MSTSGPTFGQIKALVSDIRRKLPEARTIGIKSSRHWMGANLSAADDDRYLIRQCDSPLEMRIALREKTDDSTVKVLITSLDDKDLSSDILVRLAKRQLIPADSWRIVQSLFEAKGIDPRLVQHRWLADALLDLVPPEGYPPSRSGFLDADTAWSLLLNRAFGFAAETPDIVSLLAWASDGECVARFRSVPAEFQNGAMEWLASRAGPVAHTILTCVGGMDRPDAVALGLACGVIFHPATAGRLDRAIGKVEERYLGGGSSEWGLMDRWSKAATEVVQSPSVDSRLRRQQLQRADEILQEVQADGFGYLSDVLPSGFDQRLARYGQALIDRNLDMLRWTAVEVKAHDIASREGRRLERAEMALRLVRWLSGLQTAGSAACKSLAEAATDHLRTGGFVDWARLVLRAGDPVRLLSEAYASLVEEVTAIREEQARQFAELLKDWTAAGSGGTDVIPIENVLDTVIAPLASAKPVLLIVIDGMSVAVSRELMADLVRHGWAALTEPGQKFMRAGIAAIPSVTEVSRMSLLAGRLQTGAAVNEKAAFAEHKGLLAHCRQNSPPVLFHKASLQETDDAVLAKDVRDAIASASRRVVGVVVNAVDDHLLKGEQIDTRWTRDEIKVLPALLHEAKNAGRLVVLASDHGHVLDRESHSRPNEGGERWRADDGKPEADEFRVQGSRVVVEGNRLIAPWSEKVRFGIKKNGYHGGLTPQEMVIPIVVLSDSDDVPEGWKESAIETPAWWDETVEPVETVQPVRPATKPQKKRPATLFDMEPVPAVPAVPESAVESAPERPKEWIARLLKSPIFEEQKSYGGRAVPQDQVFERLLASLDKRGGKMTSLALARAIDYPPVRLQGLLVVVQRVLNVDGYPVIGREEPSDTIELNKELLFQQFDLG